MAWTRTFSICALTFNYDAPLGHRQQLCEILSRSNMAVSEELWSRQGFGYICTVTLTLKSRSWHTLWAWQTIAWKLSRSNMAVKNYGPDTHFRYVHCIHCDLDLGDILSQGHDILLGHWQQLCEILSRSNISVRTYDPDTDSWYVHLYALWPCPLRHDLGLRSWYILGSWTTIVFINIIQIKHCSKDWWPGHGFWLCVHCDLDLRLRVMTLTKVMTHPWTMDNNCVKYYQDPIWQWGIIARIRILVMCAQWPWSWRYDLFWRSWHIFGLWTTIV